MLNPTAIYNSQSRILYKVDYAFKHISKLFIIQTDEGNDI